MTMNKEKIIVCLIFFFYIYKSEGWVVLNLKNVIKSYKMLSSSTHSKNKQIREAALACYDSQNLLLKVEVLSCLIFYFIEKTWAY